MLNLGEAVKSNVCDAGILEGIGSAITGAVDGAKCKATALYADDKLNDPEYLNFQMRCMLNEGECDEVGNLIKSM